MATDKETNRLHRENGANVVYNNLLERDGPLNRKNKNYAKDIFTLSVAYGYKNKTKIPLGKNSDDFLNAVNWGDNLHVIVKALAISKSPKGIQVLAEDNSEINSFVEEYANGGLELLNADYVGNEDEFIEKLRLFILEANKKDKILKKLESMDLSLID